MNHPSLFRKLALSMAIMSACGAGMAQSGAPASPATSPTVTGTIKPGTGNQPATGMSTNKSATSPTVTGTITPGNRDQPGMTPGSGTSGSGMAASPTATQTVKPMSRSARARHDRRMARRNAAKSEQTGSGSAGKVAGRVEGSTSSNSDGKPSKAP